jgi:hypothetical protein
MLSRPSSSSTLTFGGLARSPISVGSVSSAPSVPFLTPIRAEYT